MIEGQGGLGVAFVAMPLAAACVTVRGRPEAWNILLISLDLNSGGGRSKPARLAQLEAQVKARRTLRGIDERLHGGGAVTVLCPDRVP
ncbi:MAG: hypothetical protein AAFN17_12950 [Pseudomonadota bacterium]